MIFVCTMVDRFVIFLILALFVAVRVGGFWKEMDDVYCDRDI